MLQKIIKVGNSYAFTIPSSFIKGVGLKLGDQLDVEADQTRGRLTATKPVKAVKTTEVKEWLESFNNKYKKGLTKLAKR